jgi:hypothetical protein
MLRRHFEQRKREAVYRSCRPASAAAFLVCVAACGQERTVELLAGFARSGHWQLKPSLSNCSIWLATDICATSTVSHSLPAEVEIEEMASAM